VVTWPLSLSSSGRNFTVVSVLVDVEEVLLGQEFVQAGLVDPADQGGLLLAVADALGQGERRGDHVQQAEGEEATDLGCEPALLEFCAK
jgi:hypothetical protein